MDDMQEIMDDFFQEADESLDELEQDLIKLETVCDTGTFDTDLVDRIFRVLHTLKGGAGFLNLELMASLSHAGESLLDEVRNGSVKVSTAVMDALLKTNDLLKELLEKEKSGEDPNSVDISGTVNVLEKLVAGENSHSEPKTVAKPEQSEVKVDAPKIAINEELLAEIRADDRLTGGEGDVDIASEPEQSEVKVDTPKIAINEELLAEIRADDRLTGGEGDVQEEHSTAKSEDKAIEGEIIPIETVVKDSAEEAVVSRGAKPEDNRREKEDRRKQPRRQSEAEVTIRVETGKLDKTMNLVGELVLARNSLMRFLNLPEMKEVLQTAPYINEVMTNIEHLSQVTKDLQLSVLSTRMQAIKKVFDKIPRQVRDLKSKLNREVDLVIVGEYTEVDKTLVEELADPMVHLIRNSLDHGIETPDDREAIGKKRTGTLTVSAFYEGNKVVIQVKDDGAGIDPEKIKNLALKKGLISEKDAENISDEDAVKLIMAPGFSTAEVVSAVSGRGVGMDVVNSSIQAIKGSVDIVSEFGVGTTINIYLPLTLAIVQALVVKSRREGFAIPIGDINEVIKFHDRVVHKMNDQDVIELRGEVLPLFYLSGLTSKKYLKPDVVEVTGHVETKIIEAPKEQESDVSKGLGEGKEASQIIEEKVLKPKEEAKASHQENDNINNYVVVVRKGKQALGLVVDDLIGQEEAVIKALSGDFEYHSAISGATITGDGTVHMILDVPYLIKEISKR